MINPAPRYILLETWRVDVVRHASYHSNSRRRSTGDSQSSSTSSTSDATSSSGATSAQYDVELPTVYKQLIALFRSIHTLLRVLPLWKLQRKLKKLNRAGRNAMSLELRINSPESLHSSQSTTSSSTSYDSSLPDSIDGSPIVQLTTPLSKNPDANRLKSFSFEGINSPLGELRVQTKYRAESDFTIEFSETLISDQFSANATVEAYSLSTYPAPPYPPVASRVSTVPEEKSGLLETDGEFEALEANFTPTVVAEEQKRRRESQLGKASTSPPLYGLPRSPLNRGGSLPRESPGSAIGKWRSSTPTQGALGTSPPGRYAPRGTAGASPPPSRPRFTSIGYPQSATDAPTALPMINTSTTTQIPRAPLSAYPSTSSQPVHTRTISMPPINRPATTSGSSVGRFAGLSRIDDLPFASTPSIAPNSVRRRKESSSALSSTSSAGAASAMPVSPLRTASPRSRAALLPLPTPSQPLSNLGSTNGPRRPSLNAIHPFKSSTLSSSPGSFGSPRNTSSPIEPPGTVEPPRGSLGSIREFGTGPESPRFNSNRTLSPRLGTQVALEPVPTSKRLSQGSSDGRSSARLSGADIATGIGSSKRYSSSFANRYTAAGTSGESSSAGATGGGRRSEDVPRDSLGLAGAGLPIPAPSSSRRPRTEVRISIIYLECLLIKTYDRTPRRRTTTISTVSCKPSTRAPNSAVDHSLDPRWESPTHQTRTFDPVKEGSQRVSPQLRSTNR